MQLVPNEIKQTITLDFLLILTRGTVFPVLVLVFDFEEFSEGVLHGHWLVKQCKA
jgi:hypothetical protein